MNFLDETRKQGKAFKEKAAGQKALSIRGTGTDYGGTSICKTPGLRIRSRGRGRGLARGRGRGQIGIPFGGGG